MSNAASPPPEQGQLVDVRQRRWVVNDVAKSTLPANPLETLQKVQHLVTLSSAENDALGEELQVILNQTFIISTKIRCPDPWTSAEHDRLDRIPIRCFPACNL